MTLEEARTVLANFDRASSRPFSREEREAIIAVGAAYLAREITREQAAELLGIDIETGRARQPS